MRWNLVIAILIGFVLAIALAFGGRMLRGCNAVRVNQTSAVVLALKIEDDKSANRRSNIKSN
jgi:hypothetical protein